MDPSNEEMETREERQAITLGISRNILTGEPLVQLQVTGKGGERAILEMEHGDALRFAGELNALAVFLFSEIQRAQIMAMQQQGNGIIIPPR